MPHVIYTTFEKTDENVSFYARSAATQEHWRTTYIDTGKVVWFVEVGINTMKVTVIYDSIEIKEEMLNDPILQQDRLERTNYNLLNNISEIVIKE